MKRLPLLFVGGLIVVAAVVPITGGRLGGAEATPSPAAPALGSATDAPPAATAGATLSPAPVDGATQAPATEPPPTATPAPVLADVPIVPVVQFRSTRTTIERDEIAQVLAGRSDRFEALELVDADADAILAALDLERPAAGDEDLVLAPDAATLTGDLADHRKRLALIRAAQVTPAVRALAWDRTPLFGVGRVTSLADWPLSAALAVTPADGAFDPAATWTLFAGGDILLDRGVYETVRKKGKGVDYPFDGGTVDITGHCKDCSPLGWDTPYTERTGNKGVVRELIEGADLAIANFENPAPDAFRWHTSGTIFSADAGIIEGIANAGIDWLSLANNHMGDQGDRGLLQTIDNVEAHGLAHGGAGVDAAAARTPSILEVGDTTVAILAYDAIYKPYHATKSSAGTARFTIKNVTADIAKARDAGADLVIVFPHWGREYHYQPTDRQREQAHAILDAGADMLIGNHAHYAAAMEVYKGKPIWYALGNFVFDQTWSEPTMSGITLELTFDGARLVQARMHPHLILDKAQPNLLDPAGDGKVVLRNVYGDLLPW